MLKTTVSMQSCKHKHRWFCIPAKVAIPSLSGLRSALPIARPLMLLSAPFRLLFLLHFGCSFCSFLAAFSASFFGFFIRHSNRFSFVDFVTDSWSTSYSWTSITVANETLFVVVRLGLPFTLPVLSIPLLSLKKCENLIWAHYKREFYTKTV